MNTGSQLALDFTRPVGKGPEVHGFQVEAMITTLRGKGWQTAKQLGAETESDKRILRAVAEDSDGQIISGQKGYMLTIEATPADLAAASWLQSQGNKMLGRWIAIQRVWHRGLKGATA